MMLTDLKKLSKSAIIVLAVFFLVSMQLTIIYAHLESAHYSVSILSEIYCFFQFVGMAIFLMFLLKRYAHPTLGFLAIFLMYAFYLVLEFYLITTHTPLDFAFLKSGMTDICFILKPYVLGVGLISLISLPVSFLFFSASEFVFKKRPKVTLVLLIMTAMVIPQFLPEKFNNKIFVFVKSAIVHDGVLSHYRIFYDHYLKESETNRRTLLSQAKAIQNEPVPEYLENIIFLQLESVNSYLVGEQVTPNLVKNAERGIFFPKFYSNSVQTILGQESLLCSLPTSLDSSLVKRGKDKKVTCLPEILNSIGYGTFFLKTFDLKFARTGEFMQNLGFSHVHAKDIMKKGDPEYTWGFREDIFYKRAFSFFQKNKTRERNFIYLEVGPTNHWPFNVPNDYDGRIPFASPKSYKEKLSNTTYIQDKYLGVAMKEIEKTFPKGNYTVFILSDHGWPIGVHENNQFNEKGSYEENFLTSMAVIVGEKGVIQNQMIKEKYSLMDIMPTLLDILGFDVPKNDYSQSFGDVFRGKSVHKRVKSLLVQPYSSKYLNIIRGDIKYQYDHKNKRLIAFDLSSDSQEKNPKIISEENKTNVSEFSTIVPLLDNKNVIMHAMGEINGLDYTNSLEALEYHYERGRRFFEIDLALTNDGKVVVAHSVKIDATEEEFLSRKIANKLTPLSLYDVIQIMKEKEELFVVTDMKSNFAQIIEQVTDVARKEDERILDRIIPQIYSKETYKKAITIHPFKEFMYTLYLEDPTDNEVVEFAGKVDRIKTVTMSADRFTKKRAKLMRSIGKKVFVHTLNDPNVIRDFIRKGADGIYSDSY